MHIRFYLKHAQYTKNILSRSFTLFYGKGYYIDYHQVTLSSLRPSKWAIGISW